MNRSLPVRHFHSLGLKPRKVQKSRCEAAARHQVASLLNGTGSLQRWSTLERLLTKIHKYLCLHQKAMECPWWRC